MPVTENTSLLFSSCHLAIAILVNKIKRLAVFRVWKNTLFSEITSFIWPKWFCLLFSKIVDSKQSGPYLFKFPIEKCIFFLFKTDEFLHLSRIILHVDLPSPFSNLVVLTKNKTKVYCFLWHAFYGRHFCLRSNFSLTLLYQAEIKEGKNLNPDFKKLKTSLAHCFKSSETQTWAFHAALF